MGARKHDQAPEAGAAKWNAAIYNITTNTSPSVKQKSYLRPISIDYSSPVKLRNQNGIFELAWIIFKGKI